jgi:hypothetical protein
MVYCAYLHDAAYNSVRVHEDDAPFTKINASLRVHSLSPLTQTSRTITSIAARKFMAPRTMGPDHSNHISTKLPLIIPENLPL